VYRECWRAFPGSGVAVLEPQVDPDHPIYEEQDGEDVICLVKSAKPDLVMLDISMHRVDGFSVLRAIKNMDQSIKVLIISMQAPSICNGSFSSRRDGYA
jgi:CheY-like chemotaxis protein